MLKLNLSLEETKLLLTLLWIGSWIYESAKEDEEDFDPQNKARKLEDKICNTLEKSEYKSLVERFGDRKEHIWPINEIDEEIEEIIEVNSSENLYGELPIVLGKRDMYERWEANRLLGIFEDGRYESMTEEEIRKHSEELNAYYAYYEDEIEKNGMQNFRIVYNPLFTKR